MNIYNISYDLIKPDKDYRSLHNAIQKLSNWWWHHLDSTWLIASELNSTQIKNMLMLYIDKNDKLLVTTLSGEAAWSGIPEEASKWLRSYLSRSDS